MHPVIVLQREPIITGDSKAFYTEKIEFVSISVFVHKYATMYDFAYRRTQRRSSSR